MVLLAIHGITRNSQNVTQRLLRRVTRLTAPEAQTDSLRTAYQPKHEIN